MDLTGVRVSVEEFNKETPHRSRRAGVRLGVVCDAWEVGSGLVRKTMHCTAVNNELPIGTSAVHFFNKSAHLRHWDMRVQGTVADEYPCFNQLRLSWSGRV